MRIFSGYRLFVGFCLAVVCAPLLLVAQATTPAAAPWSYSGEEGPGNWGRLDPTYKVCGQGHEQSPIDIHGAKLNTALQPIEFHYIAGTITEVNTGHTVEMRVAPGSYIVAGGVRYDLVQFHFHHPGEEAVKGKLSDMAVHLVHKSADGKLAVIAVRLNEGRGDPNVVLAALWEHLPQTAGASEKVPDLINPIGLLPTDRGYWTYVGSLTAPPCTEGVRWFVFEEEKELSRTQLRAFAALFKYNARPLQTQYGRRIEANE